MREFRGLGLTVLAAVLLVAATIALCAYIRPDRDRCPGNPTTPSRGLAFRSSCGCPLDTRSFTERTHERSILVAYLSPFIAAEMEEKNAALSLEEKGKLTMRKNSRPGECPKEDIEVPSEAELALRFRRAQERIELAKKIIQEQEFSSRLEHLKVRREMARKTKSQQ